MSLYLIKKFQEELEKIIQYGGSRNEGAISLAFQNLLNEYYKKKNLLPIPQKTKTETYSDASIPKQLKPILKADKDSGVIYIDRQTRLENIPKETWQYKLGNRSAVEWVLDQYKEKKIKDPTVRAKFNTYKFADYKNEVIELIKKVIKVSIETVDIIKKVEGKEK